MAEGPDPSAKSTPLLNELSNALESVVDWYPLGLQLGLKDHELRTISRDFHGDNERCKLEMLGRWLRNAKLPTWKAVVDALQLTGERKVALKILNKHCISSNTTDAGTSLAIAPPDPSAAVAQHNIIMIRGKFAILVTKSRKRLQNKGIDVEDIQTFLVTMYSSPKSRDGSGTVMTVLESAKSLDDIFRALGKYGLWDYINYYLLQSIIEAFACDDKALNDMMEQYQQDLTGHILALRIQEYLDATKHPITTSDSDNSADKVVPLQQKHKLFKKLTAKCKVNVTNHTLSYVVNLWKSLAKQFALPQPAMILHKVAEGCIGITWLIPANLIKYVTRMAQESANMFAEKNVLRVTLEEQCIYSMEAKPPLPETETAALKKIGVRERSLDWPGERDLDEQQNPEDIPEYKLKLRGCIVMCTNYSFLWEHLEPSQLLPILVDKLLMTETTKKEAESYEQKFVQNAVIIRELFASDCPPLKLCDTLDVTGQGHIARKLLHDFKHPTSRNLPLPSADTAIHSTLSEVSKLFQQLQRQVMDLLDQFPNALAKLKQVLASLVLPLGEGKVAPLVDPLAYENVRTVRELFRLMAPYWNPLSTDLLGLLLETSICNQAASEVAEFLEAKASKGHLVLCIRQLPTLASGENDLDVADLATVHNAPVLELQSLHPAVFARLPEHKVTSTRTTVRISVEVNKPLVCIADYEEITTALSGFFEVPKAALVYAGCSKAPLVLCWLASNELVAYFKLTGRVLSGHRLLAENKVTRVAVGDQIYKCPTIKEMELFEACYYDLMGQVHYLLTTGVNVNVTLFNGGSLLHAASQEGQDEIVEMLLQAGATVDLQSKNGWTALDLASFKGHHKVVELLLGIGADPDIQDKDGRSPLYDASEKGHDRIVEMLLQAGATVNLQQKDGWTALKRASFEGHHKVVEVLLGAGANPDLQDKEGYLPLHNASAGGYDGIVEMLLQAGATVNLQTKDGWTALKRASFEGHHKVVEVLLGAGANPDLQDQEGYLPLHNASAGGYDEIVEMLLQAGATVNLQTKSGDTPLTIASCKGHSSVVRVLLQAGANMNTTTQDGASPLYLASQEGYDGIVEMLLQAGATVDLQLKSGDTPLIIASFKGHPSVARVLLQAGANVNTTTQWGGTALHLAGDQEHEDIVELLLEANADPDVPVKDSQQTALMVAAKKGNVEIVRKLIQHGANRNLTNKDGSTAHDIASVGGHTHVCQELLTK